MRPRVLIVEDDDVQATLLEALLSANEMYAEVVHTGVDAVKRLRTGFFHVGVIDYDIPGLDGLSVARVIAQTRWVAPRPMLVATTASPDRLADQLAELGPVFDLVASKPIARPALLQVIHHWCERLSGTEVPTQMATFGESGTKPSPSDQRRVLVVDDDDVVCGVATAALKQAGYEAESVDSGFLALSAAEVASYDVVVMDYHMPQMNGLAAAELIFDLFRYESRPRLVAHTSAPDRLRLDDPHWSRLFDEVVPKRNGVGALLSTVENCANYKRRRAERGSDGLVSLQRLARLVEEQGWT